MMSGTRISKTVFVASVLSIVACSNPSNEKDDGTPTGGAAAGTSSPSVDAATGANVGATTSTGSDTSNTKADSTKKASTSGNPTGASTTRPTRP